jgi:5-methylcytosine-specific restriction endonuclease McrA
MKRGRLKPISDKRRKALAAYKVVRALVLERDRGRCLLCRKAATDTHHILYRSQGGPDEAWNLISLCRTCHEKVHSEGPGSWRETLHRLAAAASATTGQ